MRSSGHWQLRAMQPMLVAFVCCVSFIPGALAQRPSGQDAKPEDQPSDTAELGMAPAKVDVQPVADDEEIRKRLQSVLAHLGRGAPCLGR